MADAVTERLDRIEARLEAIERILSHIVNSCDNMDDHIGFIHGVYRTVRSPLDYIVSKISGEESALPTLLEDHQPEQQLLDGQDDDSADESAHGT